MITKVQNNTPFKALNYSKVAKRDIGYVMDELPKLTELAKNYDITLKSKTVEEIPYSRIYHNVIDVIVSPLKENMSIFQKISAFFKPKVSMFFYTNTSPYPEAENEYLCDIAQKAIDYMEA